MADPFAGLNPYHLLGQNPAAVRTDGAGLPRSTGSSIDKAATPWHPDSGVFWLGALIVATFAGITGASLRLHAGPAKVAGNIGKA